MGNSFNYDLIVIGGGSAGITATTMAARLGARVLLVDRERLGGDCLHYGCVPSKALIASARLAHRMRRAADYGMATPDVQVDIEAVMRRIQNIKDTIGAHESPDVFRQMGSDVKFGGARFVDPQTLEVGGERLTGEKILIATGSHAVNPPIPGIEEVGTINHISVFHLKELPRRLIVVGGGPIGCEIAQSLSRLGSEVKIVQRGPRLLHREDPEIAQMLHEAFRREGIELLLEAEPECIREEDGIKKIDIRQKDQSLQLECDAIFIAIGRKPSIEALDLDKAGVAVNPRGIIVDDTLQTSQRHIFAVGDCNGGPQFTHWAEHEARIATRNALFRGRSKRSMNLIPWVTFTDPEVARVGLTLEEARKEYGEAHEYQLPMSKVDRAVCEGEPHGQIKVVVGKKEKILGVHIIGLNAGEALAEWVLAMEHGISLPQIGNAIHVYPTLGRVNRRVADMHFLENGVASWMIRLFGQFKPHQRK